MSADYEKFITPNSSLCGSDFTFWKGDCYDSSRKMHGLLNNAVTVYRAALITNNGTTLKWLEYRDTVTDTYTDDQYVVIVQLQVPINSLFESVNHKTCITFRFDTDVIVKDIFAYYNKSISEKIIPYLKESPFELTKTDTNTDYITTKSEKNNFLYLSSAWTIISTHLKVMID